MLIDDYTHSARTTRQACQGLAPHNSCIQQLLGGKDLVLLEVGVWRLSGIQHKMAHQPVKLAPCQGQPLSSSTAVPQHSQPFPQLAQLLMATIQKPYSDAHACSPAMTTRFRAQSCTLCT